MTLAVAKNCKMTKKSDIDDVIDTSKMLHMPPTLLMILTCLDDCMYHVSSPYKVSNMLAVANMSEQTPQDLCGGVRLPFGCHGNHPQII